MYVFLLFALIGKKFDKLIVWTLFRTGDLTRAIPALNGLPTSVTRFNKRVSTGRTLPLAFLRNMVDWTFLASSPATALLLVV